MRGTQGLTVACARCHDHKFDPIPTRDYYALYGVFQSSAEKVVPCASGVDAELAALVKKNRELMAKRREEQMTRSRSRSADYIAAQKELSKYPEEVFGQLLDEKDLNPYIVHRWTAWLAKNPGITPTDEVLRRSDSPCFVPDEHIANIEMYFPIGVVTELWKAQAEVDRHLLKKTSAPANATNLADRPQPSSPRVFIRGNPLTKGDTVPRQYLSLFGKQTPFTQGSGRLELAHAIISPRNPLTARVMVNRLWRWHFGKGIVTSTDNFGVLGDKPSHPELLDWLARVFIENGWSMKDMHRLIMKSSTYQMASSHPSSGTASSSPDPAMLDPENRLLWRFNIQRLEAEQIRDSILHVSGTLSQQIGGKTIPLRNREFVFNHTSRDHTTYETPRRALYLPIIRNHLYDMLEQFDYPDPTMPTGSRNATVVAPQALIMLNAPVVMDSAAALAKRLARDTNNGSIAARLHRAYDLAYGREPNTRELDRATCFIEGSPNKDEAWSLLCQSLLAANEFMYLR
jgi:hypothetical protein